MQLPVHAYDDALPGEPDVGRSACPVRRGEGGSHGSVALSPTLPRLRPTGEREGAQRAEDGDPAYALRTVLSAAGAVEREHSAGLLIAGTKNKGKAFRLSP